MFKHLIVSAILTALVGPDARAVTINTVPIGNPGNANDPATGNLYGGVAYNYRIGTYDVTNSQYAEFLNTKDPSGFNTLGLWNSGMANATFGGISLESGNAIGSKYALTTGRENQPVNYVNWYEAVRFVNWLNNGQGNSSTENGAYKLGRFDENGVPINGEISRNAGAKVFLPNKDEWYKAAYYNPATNSYFQYPTSSNDIPLTSGPTGLPNHANASPDGPGNLTDIGAYSGTSSPYGAYDMGGNVWQWTEDPFPGGNYLLRNVRGGSFADSTVYLGSSASGVYGRVMNDSDLNKIGFRVALVPEPSTLALAALGGVGLLAAARREMVRLNMPGGIVPLLLARRRRRATRHLATSA